MEQRDDSHDPQVVESVAAEHRSRPHVAVAIRASQSHTSLRANVVITQVEVCDAHMNTAVRSTGTDGGSGLSAHFPTYDPGASSKIDAHPAHAEPDVEPGDVECLVDCDRIDH